LSTLLYQPPPEAEFIAFLLWEAGDAPPGSIPSRRAIRRRLAR
jgi:hypothetical protein